MRYRPRVDANQKDIVKALRQLGCSVESLAGLGKGKPDLLIGRCGLNLILEVKDGSRKPSERRLTPDEERFRDGWAGQYQVVESVEQAVKYVMEETQEVLPLILANGGAVT